jgi:hypothetical protein
MNIQFYNFTLHILVNTSCKIYKLLFYEVSSQLSIR